MSEKLANLERAMNAISDGTSKIVFAVPDTKGNPIASVAHIYEIAMQMHKNGYNVGMLSEKNDYTKPGQWLGNDYDKLEHYSMENNDLQVSAADFLIIPEIFGNLLEQLTQIPCEKIIFVHNVEFMFDGVPVGKTFANYGVKYVITNNEAQKNFIETYMPDMGVSIIPYFVPDYFIPTDKPNKPIVSIHSRDQRVAAKIIKEFYLKYPFFKWVSFKDMHGKPRDLLAQELKESCVSVWVDDYSGFSTYALESLKCNIPIIGKAPAIVQPFLTEENGIWTVDTNQIPDLLANYMNEWISDTTPDNLLNVKDSVEGLYGREEMDNSIDEVFNKIMTERKDYIKQVYESENNNLVEESA